MLDKTYKVELSIRNLVLILGFLIGLFLIWKLQAVIFLFFFSFILSSALRPLVDALNKRYKVPKPLSIFIIYLLALIFFLVIIYVSAVTLTDQLSALASNFSNILGKTATTFINLIPGMDELLGFGPDENIQPEVTRQIDNFLKNDASSIFNIQFLEGAGLTLISAINSIVAILFGLFTVLVVSAYMTTKDNKFYDGLLAILPGKYRISMQIIIEKVEKKLGQWFLGQVSLMFIVGIATYIGLALPGIPFDGLVITRYALALALIAGILEAIPNIGPVLTWFIAVVITVGSGGSVGEIIYIAGLFTLIQQAEGVFIVPVVMKKAIGLDPIVTILGLIAASTLIGIVGALLVLPIIATIQIVVNETLLKNSEEKVAV